MQMPALDLAFAPPVITGTSSREATDILCVSLSTCAGATSRTGGGAARTGQHLGHVARADGPRPPGAGDLVPAHLDREQNTAMRRRGRSSAARAATPSPARSAPCWPRRLRRRIPAGEIHALLKTLRIRPILTAHPTEAKRVTVLENSGGSTCCCANSNCRAGPSASAPPDGRPARPDRARVDDRRTPPREAERRAGVAWGLHFFDETLFEMLPEVLVSLEESLREHYPDETFEVPAFFQFGSWIGGDRDGNPFVTAAVTRATHCAATRSPACAATATASRRSAALSITERSLPVPAAFRAELEQRLAVSGDPRGIARRNPGEPYRQFLTCIQRGWRRRSPATRATRSPARRTIPTPTPSSPTCGLLEQGLAAARCSVAHHRPRAAGAADGRDLPVLDRAPRHPREHHPHHPGAPGAVRRSATATTRRRPTSIRRSARLARRGAGPAGGGRALVPALARRGPRVTLETFALVGHASGPRREAFGASCCR